MAKIVHQKVFKCVYLMLLYLLKETLAHLSSAAANNATQVNESAKWRKL